MGGRALVRGAATAAPQKITAVVLDTARLELTAMGAPVVPTARVTRKRVPQVGGRDGVRFVPSPRQIQVLGPVADRDAKAAATVAAP